MRKIYLLVAVTVAAISCKPKTEEIKEKGIAATQTYLNIQLPKDDTTFFRLDSVVLIKIDSFTEKREMDIPMRRAARLMQGYTILAQGLAESAKRNMEIADLDAKIWGASKISEALLDAKENTKLARAYVDTANSYQKILDALQLRSKTADNIKLKIYSFKVLVQFTRKDMTYWKDTMNIPVTLDYHVKPPRQIADEYFKVLH